MSLYRKVKYFLQKYEINIIHLLSTCKYQDSSILKEREHLCEKHSTEKKH